MFSDNSNDKIIAKLKILQIMEQFALPLTNSQLTEFTLENEFVNYFSLQECLNELVESSFLEYSESDGTSYYLLTESGRNTIEFFRNRIPQFIRRNINDAVENKKKSIVVNTRVLSDYEKNDSGEYTIKLSANENSTTLIELQLCVASNILAKQICKNWKDNAQFLYGDILKLLSENNE